MTDTVKQSSADDMIANLRRQITDLQNTAVDAIRQRDAALAHNAPSADIEHTLLRCPFCGGKGMLHQNRTAQALWRVACVNCDAGPHSAFGEFGAARLWNERITDAAQAVREPVGYQFRQRSGVGKGPQSSAPWCDWCFIDRETYERYQREPSKLVQVRPVYAAPVQSCSAGSEPVAWMCEKAIWETVETQRIGGRWLRYLTFDRPAEAEYTRNITPLYSVSPQPMSVTEVLREVAEPLARTLIRCQTVLGNMAEENEGPGVFFFNRWPINHEPLRADAKNLVPIVSQALSAYHAAFMKIEREAASALSRPNRESSK